MSTDVKPINTIPLQQFIDRVKVADNSNQAEVRMTLVEAKNLAFTIGSVMSVSYTHLTLPTIYSV